MTQDEFVDWCENVTDNLSALISIVTKMAEMSPDDYKAIVLRIRSQRDQMNAEERDTAAGQAAEPR